MRIPVLTKGADQSPVDGSPHPETALSGAMWVYSQGSQGRDSSETADTEQVFGSQIILVNIP